MRVLVLSHLFPNQHDSAAGVFVLEQVKQLRAAGVDCVVVSPTPLAPRSLAWHSSVKKYAGIAAREVIDDIEVVHPRVLVLPKNLSFPFEGFEYYLTCRGFVATCLRDGGIDLIHAHTIMPDGFGAVLLGREFNLPVVCTVHGSDIRVYPRQNRLTALATRWALKRVSRLVAVSEDLARNVETMIVPSHLTVARNGADPEIFRPASKTAARAELQLSQDKKIVTFVGYFREDKGLTYLLKAFALLKRVDARLCLVGDGPLRGELIAKAAEFGIADSCTFAGSQQHSAVAKWLDASDCLVLSSLTEGLPTILPEAMLCRVPVIATRVGGVPEVVRDRETGLLVPSRDSEALASAIQRVLESPALSSQLSDRAYSYALQQLTWEANARINVSVYQEALRITNSASHPSVSRVRPVQSGTSDN